MTLGLSGSRVDPAAGCPPAPGGENGGKIRCATLVPCKAFYKELKIRIVRALRPRRKRGAICTENTSLLANECRSRDPFSFSFL